MTIKSEPLPEGLEEFILNQFQTVTEVEVLCYFMNHKGMAFSAKTLCKQLFLSETMTSQILVRLLALEFVTKNNKLYKYVEGNPAEGKNFLKELCSLFNSRKSVIVEILFNSFLRES